jgi:hypothetical protein
VGAATDLARDAALRNRLRAAAAATFTAQSWETIVARFEADLAAVIAGAAR